MLINDIAFLLQKTEARKGKLNLHHAAASAAAATTSNFFSYAGIASFSFCFISAFS